MYDELENKEKEIDEMKDTIKSLKNKKDSKCQNQCSRMEEVLKYAEKNKTDAFSVKEIAESQKVKISCLRGHRNLVEVKEQLSDKVDELDLKSKEIELLVAENKKKDLGTSSKSLQDEIDFAAFENNKIELETKVKSLKGKLNVLSESQKEKFALFEKIEELSKQRESQVEYLENHLKSKQPKKIRCVYKWKGKRWFCKFDHSYLRKK